MSIWYINLRPDPKQGSEVVPPRVWKMLRDLQLRSDDADGSAVVLWPVAHPTRIPETADPPTPLAQDELVELKAEVGSTDGPRLVLIDVTSHAKPDADYLKKLLEVIQRLGGYTPPSAKADNWLERAVQLHLHINKDSMPFGPVSFHGGPVSILIADAPVEAPFAPVGFTSENLCVETPECVTPHLIRTLARLASATRDTRGQVPDRLDGFPLRLWDIPPSPWWDYSPQRKVLHALYKLSPQVVDEMEYALVIPKGQKAIEGTLDPGGGEDDPERKFRAANLRYVLRLSRRLATWGLEGDEVQCTLVLADRAGFEKPFVPLGDDPACVYCLEFTGEKGLHLSNHELRGHTEMLQTGEFAALVNWQSLEMDSAVSHVHAGDHYRGTACVRLAKAFEGYVVSVRDHRVELYTNERLALWHDGFEWQWEPFRTLEERLQRFFSPEQSEVDPAYKEGDELLLARRVVGAFSELLDRRASSIVAFVDLKAYDKPLPTTPRPLLGPVGTNPVLVPMRCHVQSRLTTHATPRTDRQTAANFYAIKCPSLQALIGMLKVDGVHIIRSDGSVSELGYRITSDGQGDESAGGSGRTAARLLSGDLGRSGFVVKVSASGYILMFENGQKVRSPAPALATSAPVPA